MVQATKDLWGELNFKVAEPTPLDILREQAYLLDEKTKNLLRGELLSSVASFGGGAQKQSLHVFNIVAPGLRNRRTELLRFTHPASSYFPAKMTVKNGDARKEIDVTSFGQFEKLLSAVLSSPQTKELLQSLISVSKPNGKAAL